MNLKEHYNLYKIAYELVDRHQFDILHIQEDKEIWLEKYEQKTSHVIRLQQGGFDWKNHLKNDVAVVFQKVKSLKRMLRGKYIQIYNIYISAHEPMDDWDFLKQPMQLKQKQFVKMHVYYMSNMHNSSELERFQSDINADHLMLDPSAEDDLQRQVHNYKHNLNQRLAKKQNEKQDVFSKGKPIWTYILLALNILMFLVLTFAGGSKDVETLIQYGAKYNVAIIEDGQWWRIITSMFLHIGFLHLVMNMLAVYFLGTAAERIYGSWRFIVIYFFAGISGGITSFAFTSTISAGASGALFGLFGALLYFGTVYRRLFLQTLGPDIIIILVINLVLGFTGSQIDMGAHLGGLVGGFLISAVVSVPNKKRTAVQIASGIAFAVLLVSLTSYGLQANTADPSYYSQKISQLNQDEKYNESIDEATTALDNPGDQEAILYFQRSVAYMMTNQINRAISDLEQAVELNDEFTDAYRNLALAYYQTGKSDKASTAIKQAYELNPDAEKIDNLYEEITGQIPD